MNDQWEFVALKFLLKGALFLKCDGSNTLSSLSLSLSL